MSLTRNNCYSHPGNCIGSCKQTSDLSCPERQFLCKWKDWWAGRNTLAHKHTHTHEWNVECNACKWVIGILNSKYIILSSSSAKQGTGKPTSTPAMIMGRVRNVNVQLWTVLSSEQEVIWFAWHYNTSSTHRRKSPMTVNNNESSRWRCSGCKRIETIANMSSYRCTEQ